MKENPEETPNPLNPNGGGQAGSNVVDSFVKSTPLDANPAEPTPAAVETEEVAVEEEVTEVKANDPLNRPMQQAPTQDEAAQPTKKKTGLIIGAIVALLLAIGLIVAAAILAMQSQSDPVNKAFSKVLNGQLPPNVAVDGTIEIIPNTANSQITSFKVDLDSQAATNATISTAQITITASIRGGDDLSLTFDGIYAANGDLYFRLDGVKNIIKNTEPTDTNESLAAIMGIGQLIDGEWLRISTDEIASMTDEATNNSSLGCLVDLANDARKNSNSFTRYYNNNPFIYSIKDNITVTSKQNPIYEVSVDKEKFINFMNAIQGSGPLQDFYNCMGDEYAEVNIDDVIDDIESLPALYVEIDKDYNFTRLYSVGYLGDDAANIITDLNFTYPANINVSEPVEYRDFLDVMQEIFSGLYELPAE